MFNAYHIIDAVPAAFFGIVALWATGSRLHWFLRTAAVLAVVTAPLLFGGYGITVTAAVECMTVLAGVAVWRSFARASRPADEFPKPRFRPRVSLKDLLMLTVVVGVVTAVIANLPIHFWASYAPGMNIRPEWTVRFSKGLIDGCAVLAFVWLASSHRHWTVRAILAFSLICIITAITAYVFIDSNNLYRWQSGGGWSSHHFSLFGIYKRFIPGWLWTYTIIAVLIYVWAWLVKRAGALSRHHPSALASTSDSPRVGADAHAKDRFRQIAIAYTLLVGLLPAYILYKLTLPIPISKPSLPDSNGFDELVRAGQMISDSDAQILFDWYSATANKQAVQSSLANCARVFDKVREAFLLPYRFPYPFDRAPVDVKRAIHELDDAMEARIYLLSQDAEIDVQLSTCRDVLRLAHERLNGPGIEQDTKYIGWERRALGHIGVLRRKLSAAQCREMSQELARLDANRVPWDDIRHRLQVIQERTSWQFRLLFIADAWSGMDRYRTDRMWYFASRTKLRLAAIDLALRAYQQERGFLPESLSALTPGYLQDVPIDPYVNRPFCYRVTGNSYLLYGVGRDLVDNGGKPEEVLSWDQDGDITFEYLVQEFQKSLQIASDKSTDSGSQSDTPGSPTTTQR